MNRVPQLIVASKTPRWMRRFGKSLLLAFFLTAGMFILQEIQQTQTLRSKATFGSAKVFIVPKETTMPPASIFQVWVSVDRPTAFVHTTLHFDSNVLMLTQPLSFTNAPLTRIVQTTTPQQANESGSIVIASALDPANKDNPATNTFLLGTLIFASRTQDENIQTAITIDTTSTQIVQPDGALFIISQEEASLVINPNVNATLAPTTIPSQEHTPTTIIPPTISSTQAILPTTTNTTLPTLADTPLPSPITTPTFSPVRDLAFDIRIRLAGVQNANARGADATVRFVKNDLDLITEPIPIEHVANGIYTIRFNTTTDLLAPGNGYTIVIKGEKHIARKFCLASNQVTICQPTDSLTIPEPNGTVILYDFTGLPLAPGDLNPQDGRASFVDFENIKTRLSIVCDQLTTHDRLVADINYNGCIDALDAYWMRNTLETRYDEN